jgi:hypothetical protein
MFKVGRNETLAADDYRALLKNYYVRGEDSPLKKNLTGLRDQWHRRSSKYNVDSTTTSNVMVEDVRLDQLLASTPESDVVAADGFFDYDDVFEGEGDDIACEEGDEEDRSQWIGL